MAGLWGFIADEVGLPQSTSTFQSLAEQRTGDGLVACAVSYGYAVAALEKRQVLHEVDLRVPWGTSLAVVGGNGAGKSTLARLLLGLDQPWSGTVTLDGTPLRDAAQAGCKTIAGAFQDFARFKLSVRENLTLLSRVPATDAALWEMMERYGIAERVRGLQGDLDAVLGSGDEGASELSLGEWQRLVLCRVALAAPNVVVLDEPTAFLDSAGSNWIVDDLLSVRPDEIKVLITHDAKLASCADQIVTLSEGRIVLHQSSGESIDGLANVFLSSKG